MAYSHQQNFYDGASAGYVKFSIAPGIGSYIAPGEAVTVTGQAYDNLQSVSTIVMSIYPETIGSGDCQTVSVSKSIKKGAKGTFEMTFTLEDRMYDAISSRSQNLPFTFSLLDSSGAGDETVGSDDQYLAALTYRIPPAIESAAISDDTGAQDHFGAMVAGESMIRITLAETTDDYDPTTQIASRTLTLGGTEYDLAAQDVCIGAVDLTGEVGYSVIIRDNKGLSSEILSGTVTVLPYARPVISSLSTARYASRLADDGTVSYLADDAGEQVWLSFTGSVCAAAGKNAWTLKAKITPDEGEDEITVLSGDDGGEIILENDRGAISSYIFASARYAFTLTLTDFFGSASLTTYVEKAAAYFDIEPYGAAVGMRAAGSLSDKRFEVAEDHKSLFYGGAYGFDGRRMDAPDMDILIPDDDIAEGFEAYAEEFTPRVTRVGAMVQLSGIIRVTTEADGEAEYSLFTLPEWARPAVDVHAIQQGTSANLYWLRIYTDGTVAAMRYRISSTYSTMRANAQLTLHAVWIAADVFEEG